MAGAGGAMGGVTFFSLSIASAAARLGATAGFGADTGVGVGAGVTMGVGTGMAGTTGVEDEGITTEGVETCVAGTEAVGAGAGASVPFLLAAHAFIDSRMGMNTSFTISADIASASGSETEIPLEI